MKMRDLGRMKYILLKGTKAKRCFRCRKVIRIQNKSNLCTYCFNKSYYMDYAKGDKK